MATKNFENIFNPKSIAVIGANPIKNTVGLGLCQNLLEDKQNRQIFFVNPFEKEVLGQACMPNLKDIKENIDLAVIAVPAKFVPQAVDDCIAKKVGAVIIISAGFGETGEQGLKIQNEIKQKLNNAKISLVGPNCLGVLNPQVGLNASFAPATPKSGQIALISQSGALIDSIIDISLSAYFGFSKIVSIGNEGDLDISDFISYLATDSQTKVIGIYVEAIKDGRKFMTAVKKCAKDKPVVVLKAGKSQAGKKAAGTHTGSLAGEYQIYQAAFKQCGAIEAQSVEELLDFCKILAWAPTFKQNVAIVTNGGGVGVLTTDYCQQFDLPLATIKPATIKNIEATGKISSAWSRGNPADVLGDATTEKYGLVCENILSQNDVGALVFLQTLQTMTEPQKNAQMIIDLQKKFSQKPIVCCLLGGAKTQAGIDILEKNHIPNYSDPLRAIKSLKILKK